MKKLLCRLFGHKWQPYNGDFWDPYCVRCGKHHSIVEIFRDAFK
jgi:hypothetical protein